MAESRFTFKEQGLPDFKDATVESGLVPETRRTVANAKLFDVDGVITDPVEKRITNERILDDIIRGLQEGAPIGLNTGRSTEWMVDRVITPMLDRIEDTSILANFVAIGEKGGTWITFDEEGNMHHGRSSAIAVPDELKEKARELVAIQYGDSMFYDETKETMLSIEMKDGFDLSAFHERQRALNEDLNRLLTESGLEGTYKVDATTIATDVESPRVGKALGAERFEEFLRDKGISVDLYEAFGDSKSDFDMADELHRRGRNVKMVYVGDREKLGEFAKEYPVDYVGGFSNGTANYLDQQ